MDMKGELNQTYKKIIRLVNEHGIDGEKTIFRHNLKNILVELGTKYYEQNIRTALELIDVKGVD